MDKKEKVLKGLKCCAPNDEKYCSLCPYNENGCAVELIRDCNVLINNEIKTVPTDKLNAWISVEDRLPDEEFRKWEEELAEKFPYSDSPLEVIVQIDGASVATTLNYYAGEFYDNDSNFYDVTHWMPLPEPPKGNADND